MATFRERPYGQFNYLVNLGNGEEGVQAGFSEVSGLGWEQTPAEYRNGKGRGKWYDGLKNALTTTLRNRDILLCGIISSFFEGSM